MSFRFIPALFGDCMCVSHVKQQLNQSEDKQTNKEINELHWSKQTNKDNVSGTRIIQPPHVEYKWFNQNRFFYNQLVKEHWMYYISFFLSFFLSF